MTIYSQSANTDATNSELDAKQIVTHKELNSYELDVLIEDYVEIVVDNMDTQTLVQFVTETLIDDYSKLSQLELKDKIESIHDSELYYELVDNIVTEDIPLIDNNNPYKSIPTRY